MPTMGKEKIPVAAVLRVWPPEGGGGGVKVKLRVHSFLFTSGGMSAWIASISSLLISANRWRRKSYSAPTSQNRNFVQPAINCGPGLMPPPVAESEVTWLPEPSANVKVVLPAPM